MLEKIIGLLGPLLIVALVFTLLGWRDGYGPIIWLKRAAGRRLAQEDPTSRKELVDRVRQLLPQANDGNVVFSLQVETSTSGGSRVRITTKTYYYKVFVADADCLWIVPFSYDKKTRAYQLGDPVALTKDVIQNVTLAGKRGKNLKVTFWLKQGVGLDQVVMMLEPMHFQKNKFYPFNLLQEDACDKAMAVTERLAQACGKSAEDLETSRVKDECDNYAMAAGFCGFFGIVLAAATGSLVLTALLFAAAVVLFGVIIAKKQIPKISLVIVIAEAVIASLFLR